MQVIHIKVINVKKQLQCLHNVLLVTIWAEFIKIADRSLKWVYGSTGSRNKMVAFNIYYWNIVECGVKHHNRRRWSSSLLFQVYVQFLSRLYKYIICSNIDHIPYNLIFTTKFHDSSILITIISWDYFNLSLANEYVGNVTMPTQVIKYY